MTSLEKLVAEEQAAFAAQVAVDFAVQARADALAAERALDRHKAAADEANAAAQAAAGLTVDRNAALAEMEHRVKDANFARVAAENFAVVACRIADGEDPPLEDLRQVTIEAKRSAGDLTDFAEKVPAWRRIVRDRKHEELRRELRPLEDKRRALRGKESALKREIPMVHWDTNPQLADVVQEDRDLATPIEELKSRLNLLALTADNGPAQFDECVIVVVPADPAEPIPEPAKEFFDVPNRRSGGTGKVVHLGTSVY
jgi:hypothetical protein